MTILTDGLALVRAMLHATIAATPNLTLLYVLFGGGLLMAIGVAVVAKMLRK